MLLFWDGRLVEARDRLAALHAEALERGDEHSLPFVLFQLARVELLLGDWAGRRAPRGRVPGVRRPERAGRRARRTRWRSSRSSPPTAARSTARVALIERGLELAEARGVRPAALELLATRGFLELSLGEPADATFDEVPRGRRGQRAARAGALPLARRRGRGRRAPGRPVDLELDRDRPWIRSVAARIDLLLGERAEPDDAGGQPFERARYALVLGARERRRRWGAARAALQEALDGFEALGAPLWAQRARAELARVGGRAPADGALTPTEQRVAELIAAGRTYQEAADELFISPKTVQWNLSKVYKKLGIKSRAELPGALNPAIPPVSREPVQP